MTLELGRMRTWRLPDFSALLDHEISCVLSTPLLDHGYLLDGVERIIEDTCFDHFCRCEILNSMVGGEVSVEGRGPY